MGRFRGRLVSMTQVSPLAWAVLAVAALAIGLAKTALPGLAMLSVVAFAAWLPARESTAVALVLLIVGDVVATWSYRRNVDWATLVRLIPTVLLGLTAGGAFLAWADDVVLRRAIGVILLALIAGTIWLRRRPQPASTPRLRGLYGILGGFTTMAANAGGPVMTLYFLAARFDVARFLGTQAWFFLMVNLTKLPVSIGLGLLHTKLIWLLVVLAPLVLIGAFIGRALASRLKQDVFDQVVLSLGVVCSLLLLR